LQRSLTITNSSQNRGFTLLELSIVIIIIGLVLGGILVGRDLIKAAEVRAQISQIQSYNSAATVFTDKYKYLPGDITATAATKYGFNARGQYAGEGDGNGILEGINTDAANQNLGYYEGSGETGMFWVDLTWANGLNINLIPGSFITARPNAAITTEMPATSFPLYFPTAKLGGNLYVIVFSISGINYFGLQPIGRLSPGSFLDSFGDSLGNPVKSSLTVQQAYNIDAKIDDGLPQSGNVMAQALDNTVFLWAGGFGQASPAAIAASSSTCFDNGNNSSAAGNYSLAVNGGKGPNCELSFKFQ
jgi:prepilin-type N-terminal cleavage/methylation domain-containing protein